MPNSKQRKYTRYEINLPAILKGEDTGAINCNIRDFSSGGMFLELQEEGGYVFLLLQEKVQIKISLNTEKGLEDYKFDAIIMHINSTGIGIALDENDTAVYNVLKNEAEKRFTWVNRHR